MHVTVPVSAGALNIGDQVGKIMGRVQLTPPKIASTRSQMTGRRRRLSARNTNARRSFDFMI